MATEKNPFDIIPQDAPSVVPMESVEETEKTETTFELDGLNDLKIVVNDALVNVTPNILKTV